MFEQDNRNPLISVLKNGRLNIIVFPIYMKSPRLSHTLALTLVAALALLSSMPAADAVALVLYDFGTSSDNLDADDYVSKDVDLNSTASDLTRSSGYGAGATADWPNPNSATVYTDPDWRLRRKGQPTYFEGEGDDLNYLNDYTRAFDAGTNYLEWTLTPVGGYEIDLDSFSLDVGTSNSRFFYYYLSSSIDGYNTVIGSVGGVEVGSATVNVSLSGAQFQDLTTATTFRLWTWGNQSGSSGSAWALDDLTINGTAAPIPEPGSLGLLAFASIGLLRRQRHAAGN